MSIRIAYVAYYDPRDITKWSGTGYHMHRSMAEAGAHIELIGPLKNQHNPVNIARYLWNTKVRGLNDHPHRDPGFLRHYARQVEKQLRGTDADIIVGPGGLPLCYLETDLPIVVWTDCTFASLLNYYEAFKNMSARSVRDGHRADKALFDRCYRAMFSCQWAADSAINDYGYDPRKCEIVSLGANVPFERNEQQARDLIASRNKDEMQLLFLGVQWIRKGGDFALKVGEELVRRGLPIKMKLVGAAPPEGQPIPEWAEVVGFIKKSTPEGLARIGGLLDTSHFMVLPTLADCTPIVFNEASSAALPVLTTRTGGVPSVVHEGVNGHLFDLDGQPGAWADRIEQLWNDPEGYTRLCMSAWKDYGQRLNWDSVGPRAVEYLERAVADFAAGKP
ncbi:MAG: glycosyltransferase family 4 protein [Phycisphaerales bacterium]